MLRQLTVTTRTWVTVPLRAALGVIFIAHGAQKVFGAFGGGGLRSFMAGHAPLGLWPSWFWLGSAALAELIGGVLVLLGLFTRLGAGLLAAVMSVVLFGIHWGNFFVQERGIEFPFALLCMALALLITGGGRFSVDSNLRM